VCWFDLNPDNGGLALKFFFFAQLKILVSDEEI
jgi:hypothetical protein